jgi:hypothetical protein
VNQNGATITGYYATLRTSAGKQITTGYTTVTFTDVTANTNYEIELDGYASCTFNHWQGTGSTTDPLPFTQPNGPLTVVGVFNCTLGGSVGEAPSIGMLLSAIVSQFDTSMALIAAALAALAITRTVKIVRLDNSPE